MKQRDLTRQQYLGVCGSAERPPNAVPQRVGIPRLGPASNETAQGDDELTLAPLAAPVSAAVY
jgi:hypothetical protein